MAHDYAAGDILPNVENLVNPAMLLESETFHRLLNEASEEYRYIFIDAPPLDLVSDGEKIGSLCDGAILVVASGKVSRGMVQNSIHQLERAGCPLLGIVLNRVEDQRKKNYYQKYGYYASEKERKNKSGYFSGYQGLLIYCMASFLPCNIFL